MLVIFSIYIYRVNWTSKHLGVFVFPGDHEPDVSVRAHLLGMGTMEKLLVSKHGRRSLNSNKWTCIANGVYLPYQKKINSPIPKCSDLNSKR